MLINPVLNDMPQFAIRDPAVIYHNGLYHVYHTYVDFRRQGNIYISTFMRTTPDFMKWSPAREVFGGPNHYSSPGNVFRHPVNGRWTICIQSYPFVAGKDTGDDRCRLFLAESDDLLNWSLPAVMVEAGAGIKYNDCPRQIDPFVVLDGKRAWCFYKTIGELGLLVSEDGLKTWREALPDRPAIGRKHMPVGESVENPFVLRHDGKWWMFCSPCSKPRKIAYACSDNLTDWPQVQYLDFPEQPWAQHGPTAPSILDLNEIRKTGSDNIEGSEGHRWLMVFHGDCEPRRSGHEAVLGIAFSNDLVRWSVP